MKWGYCEFFFSGNTTACKWMDNRSVLLLSSASALERMNDILWFRGEKRVQIPSLWFLVLRLSSFTISGMGGVDLIHQRTATYRMDRKSSVGFYLHTFFDLMGIACVNSYLIYNMKHPNKLSPFDYKIVVAKTLIQCYQGPKRAVPLWRPSKRKNQPELIDNHGGNLPDY